MKTWLLSIVVILLLVCGGCRTQEPPYRVEDVVFDPTLVGTWACEPAAPDDEASPSRFRVEPREVTVRAGRLDRTVLPKSPMDSQHSAQAGEFHAYTIVPLTNKSERDSFKLAAYLLRRDNRMFVGVQVCPEQFGFLAGYIAVPLHVLWLAERNGDQITLRAPCAPIAWVPFLRPIDTVASGQPDVPSIESLKNEGIPYTQNLDRLLRVYSAYADTPSFWEEPKVFRKIGD